MIDVKQNYKNKYVNKLNEPEVNAEALLCPLCRNHVDNTENIFECSALKINNQNDKNNQFDDLFSKDMVVVAPAIKQFSKLWKIRQQKIGKK